MDSAVDDLWHFKDGHHWLPPSKLLRLVARAAESSGDRDLCYRSKLLIHDALDGLSGYYGRAFIERRIKQFPAAGRLEEIWQTYFEEGCGFPSISRRLEEPTAASCIESFLRELSLGAIAPADVTIYGSAALVLADLLVRKLTAIDVLQIPPAWARRASVGAVRTRYQLKLRQVRPLYLPEGWMARRIEVGQVNAVRLWRIDPIDVLIGKLFSTCYDDFTEVLHTRDAIELPDLRSRLTLRRPVTATSAASKRAAKNWYVLTGEEDLPPAV